MQLQSEREEFIGRLYAANFDLLEKMCLRMADYDPACADLAADAIHPDGVISNVNLDEVPIKQAMLAAGSQKVLLADSSKFGVKGFARVCAVNDLDLVITDNSLEKDWIQQLNEQQIEVELV